MMNAASMNDVGLLERALLQEFGPVNREEMDKALLRASQLGNIDIVEILLQQGASVNAEDMDGDTALSLAAANGHPSECLAWFPDGKDHRIGNTVSIRNWSDRNLSDPMSTLGSWQAVWVIVFQSQ